MVQFSRCVLTGGRLPRHSTWGRGINVSLTLDLFHEIIVEPIRFNYLSYGISHVILRIV